MFTNHASTLPKLPALAPSTLQPRTKSPLQFRDLTLADIPQIMPLLAKARSRTCDYTIGGIYMWISFFNYKFCIYNNTLFLSGLTENHTELPAFSLPIGEMPLRQSIQLLEDYCAANNIPLRFSAIPADRVGDFLAIRNFTLEPLSDWGDYLYNLSDLASLSGKKLSKKRNHVNRFTADNPGAHLDALTEADVPALIEALNSWTATDEPETDTHRQEREMTVDVLRNLSSYPFDGAVLRLADGTVAAFTLAEIIGDTIFVHIEKMDHTIAGAGEAINKMFAAHISEKYPQIAYANREEDCGDPSLRYTKESYRPLTVLAKFNLHYNPAK